MRVLVTGATTAIGYYLLPRLQAAGIEPVAIGRGSAPSGYEDIWRTCDLRNPDNIRSLPPAEILIHLAPLVLLPATLSEFRRISVRRVLAFSSTSAQTKQNSRDASDRALVSALLEAEHRVLHQGGFSRVTVFRPTLIYGGGRDQNVSAIARWIDRFGFFPVEGKATGLRQPVHADDLACACVQVIEHAPSLQGLVDLAGGEVLTYRAMVERIFSVMDLPPRVISVPRPGLQWALRLAQIHPRFRSWSPAMVARMNEDLVFSSLAAKAAFGYSPRPFRITHEDLGKH